MSWKGLEKEEDSHKQTSRHDAGKEHGKRLTTESGFYALEGQGKRRSLRRKEGTGQGGGVPRGSGYVLLKGENLLQDVWMEVVQVLKICKEWKLLFAKCFHHLLSVSNRLS